MSDIVIHVENLSKIYTIRHRNGPVFGYGGGLRHIVQDSVVVLWHSLRFHALRKIGKQKAEIQNNLSSQFSTFNSSSEEDFYALRDISFDVQRGEVLGIIGRNGAGKSTLLKILSRITEPTSGKIGIKGRVASLLEVGTGFHAELTGRENTFLNGAILGMTQKEVKQKFDEIVAFADVEDFLDTPVKHYSSGMYVRLAFAVAAHLDPEILIVDEVLAVGDAEFQKKCLGKMKEVAGGGRTVLFVSHNMAAVTGLCGTALLLRGGGIEKAGIASEVVSHYFASYTSCHNVRPRGGSGEYRLENFVCNPESSAPDSVRAFAFRFTRKTKAASVRPFVILEILDESETVVARCDTRLTRGYLDSNAGAGSIVVNSPWLKPGRYSVNAYIDSGHGFLDVWESATEFYVNGQLPYERAVSSDAYKTAPTLSAFSSVILPDDVKIESADGRPAYGASP